MGTEPATTVILICEPPASLLYCHPSRAAASLDWGEGGPWEVGQIRIWSIIFVIVMRDADAAVMEKRWRDQRDDLLAGVTDETYLPIIFSNVHISLILLSYNKFILR